MGNTIPFGERDGVMYRAFEVDNGLACGCVCPACHKPLSAANQGEIVAPYFRHVRWDDCLWGHKEGVRRAAIALLMPPHTLLLPGFQSRVSVATVSTPLSQEIGFSSSTITAERVERFVVFDEVVAHAVLHLRDKQLLVRLKTSARAEGLRYKRLEALEHSSLEIDLSGLSLEQINDPATFEHAVLNDLDNRRWIRSTRALELEARTYKALQAQAQAAGARWTEEQARLQAIADDQRKAQEQKAAAHALEREAHWAAQKVVAHKQSLNPRPSNTAGMRERREAQIVGTTMKVSTEYGHGTECSTCHLVSPPGTTFCLYCSHDQSHMQSISIARDFATTVHLRMRSSAKPDHSLRAVPVLTVEPDL
ncbi:hypothetical protein HX866_27165 [Pseudomonas gingeri]|uniref:hypothetical protein n=1 Tax=Pseudomonas gingeri TaxID=117681 RepID=UPI0015A34D4D|nr:hypothetical protein [Pseudomonas gingeri]NWA28574.1 hypothetical protein [Pseudomonas gingeri]